MIFLKGILWGWTMNREIKFRIWDERCMVYAKKDGKYTIPGANIFIDLEGQIFEMYYDEYYPLKLMQYTGLKDKNGTEIYEGDIIKYSWESEQSEGHDLITIVEWDDENSGFDPLTKGREWRTDLFGIEILGNIYENPEFLED